MEKILLLLLGCSVQCIHKEDYINIIKSMDIQVQQAMVSFIQQVCIIDYIFRTHVYTAVHIVIIHTNVRIHTWLSDSTVIRELCCNLQVWVRIHLVFVGFVSLESRFAAL